MKSILGDFDLNLTPDKRKVKISNEKLLCDRLKVLA